MTYLVAGLLLFGLLTLVMAITRRLDWYALRRLDLEPLDLGPVEAVLGQGPA